jgi:hypothetical protein
MSSGATVGRSGTACYSGPLTPLSFAHYPIRDLQRPGTAGGLALAEGEVAAGLPSPMVAVPAGIDTACADPGASPAG